MGGVPIVLYPCRKHLPVTATEVFVTLKRPPQDVFGEAAGEPRNYVRFRRPRSGGGCDWGPCQSPRRKMLGRETELFVSHQRGDEKPMNG